MIFYSGIFQYMNIVGKDKGKCNDQNLRQKTQIVWCWEGVVCF